MKRMTDMMWIIGALTLTGMSWADPAHSQEAQRPLSAEWVAIELTRLDNMRGGFDMPTGMVLSFGIERVAYINGVLVASARINIPDISKMTVEQARALSSLSDTVLIQLGPGNTFQSSGFDGVVIQNTLDNQDIRTLTTLNLGVNTLGMFQDMNTYATLQSALFNAPGRP